MTTIIAAILVLGILGFIFAGLLALASDYFHVKEDPRIEEILKILPGANCGVCGYAGCRQFAEKVVSGEAPPDACPVGKQAVADQIKAILAAAKSTTCSVNPDCQHCGGAALLR
ncbi:MAG: RnfABCDGE type electron transport complex subunit B [Candidatus Margulisbacteria bacterium]|nr:RnfABCDGE type electron transport complex subunit B [Candidatus Margulisiibacteriota bacterium]